MHTFLCLSFVHLLQHNLVTFSHVSHHLLKHFFIVLCILPNLCICRRCSLLEIVAVVKLFQGCLIIFRWKDGLYPFLEFFSRCGCLSFAVEHENCFMGNLRHVIECFYKGHVPFQIVVLILVIVLITERKDDSERARLYLIYDGPVNGDVVEIIS